MIRILIQKVVPILLVCELCFADTRLDINNSSYELIMNLPVNNLSKKELLANFMISYGEIKTIYDLLLIPDFTITDIDELKSHIYIRSKLTNKYSKLDSKSYDYGNFLVEDGEMNNASQYWLDMIVAPKDINTLGYFDLQNLPILSPMDVNAIIKAQQFEIESDFDLKNINGLSSYGLKNLEKFIIYPSTSPHSQNNFFGRMHLDINTKPRIGGSDSEAIEFENNNVNIPETYTVLRIGYGDNILAGLSFYKSMGQPDINYMSHNIIDYLIRQKEVKSYFSIEKINLGILDLDKLVVGNYSVSYGQGIILNSIDNFKPRRTGYGWNKRQSGIMPDGSKDTQFTLRGIAGQISNSIMNFSSFISYSPRDAIVNSDGSFVSLITLYPRLTWGLSGDSTKFHHSMINAVNELTYGGHLDFFPISDLRFGLSFYQSLYDRVLDASESFILETIVEDDNKFQDPGNADAEISSMYSSNIGSKLWKNAKSSRGAVGIDFSYIFKNITFQGEYGELKDGNTLESLENSSAWVVNALINFDKLDLLILYRNYGIDFDNPYQRSFSNYQRYKNTIFSYDYRLNDPIFSYLFATNAQPQAENGFYFYSRYPFHGSLLATLDWDTWTRVSDFSRYYRIKFSLEYSPIFNYSFKVSQKFQGKSPFNTNSLKRYYIGETTITANISLSNYNSISLTYLINGYYGAPRPTLVDHYDQSDYAMQVGDAGFPETSFGVSFVNHLNRKSTVSGSIYLIDGYFINSGSSDFRIFSDSNQILYTNISTDLWLSNNLKLNFRCSRISKNMLTNVIGIYPEGVDVDSSPAINSPIIYDSSIDFSLQVDYAF